MKFLALWMGARLATAAISRSFAANHQADAQVGPARDEAGVFAQIANALSSHGISIEAAIQKEPPAGADFASVVILTNVTKESAIAAAVAELAKLPQIAGPIARIRVESLD